MKLNEMFNKRLDLTKLSPQELSTIPPQDIKVYPGEAYEYAHNYKRRIPELEPIILTVAEIAYKYALNVIRGPWPEAEPVLLKKVEYALQYAINISQKRWPELEQKIINTKYGHPEKIASFIFYYAKQILDCRWLEAEHLLFDQPSFACAYARNFDCMWSEEQIREFVRGKGGGCFEHELIRFFPQMRKYYLKKQNPLIITATYDALKREGIEDITETFYGIVITDVPATISEEQFEKLFKILFPEITPLHLEELARCRLNFDLDFRDLQHVHTTTVKNISSNYSLKYLFLDIGYSESEYDEMISSDFE